MRIVIADDEFLVQETLISMINELEESWIIVGVASDGKELVELIKEHKPDLAIVDIKMPYISGLEAIQMTKNECPHMQSIVLTGYSEFSYAHEALKLGATNYLLKPVDCEELKNSLEIVKQRKNIRNDFQKKKFESSMISMVNGLGLGLLEEEDKELAELNFKMIIFYMDSGLQEKEQASRILNFYRNVNERMDKTDNSEFRYVLAFLTNGELALIGAYNKNAKNMKAWDGIIQDIETIMQAACGNGFCLTMILTECLSHFTLKEHLDEIHKASLLRILYGVNKKWQLNQLKTNENTEKMKWCKTIIMLVKSYYEGSYANYMNKTNELKEMMDGANMQANKGIKNAISHFLNNTILSPLNPSSHSQEWIQTIKDHGQKLLAQIPRSDRPQDIIQQALLFIEKNYMNDINILQIANKLQVTPNYLSTVFHKKMNITFIKYLTRMRLIKAQQLLQYTNSQVQEVAEMVGYSNPRYFTKLFTEFTGCYPSDYRKRFM